MKKIIGILAGLLMLVAVSGYVYAHCGHCGISDGYVCTKDNVGSKDPGNCPTCGAALAKGDVAESTSEVQENGKTVEKVVYAPASAKS